MVRVNCQNGDGGGSRVGDNETPAKFLPMFVLQIPGEVAARNEKFSIGPLMPEGTTQSSFTAKGVQAEGVVPIMTPSAPLWGTEKSLRIAKSHQKPSQDFSEQPGPFNMQN